MQIITKNNMPAHCHIIRQKQFTSGVRKAKRVQEGPQKAKKLAKLISLNKKWLDIQFA